MRCRRLALIALLVPFWPFCAASVAEQDDPNGAAADLYRTALERHAAGDLDEARLALVSMVNLEGPDPFVTAKGAALLGEVCLATGRVAEAAEAYETAARRGAMARSGRISDREQITWELSARVLRAHPDGRLGEKPLSAPEVMKAAFAEFAGEWAAKIQQVCSEAESAPNYNAARIILGRCDRLIDELKQMDLVRAMEAAKRHLKASENLLAAELDRVLGQMEARWTSIVEGHPHHPHHRGGYRARPNNLYYSRPEYEAARAHWERFREHNADLSFLIRLASIAEGRIEELRALHASNPRAPWTRDADARRVEELQRYPDRPGPWTPGGAIEKVRVPPKPKLYVEPPKIRGRQPRR